MTKNIHIRVSSEKKKEIVEHAKKEGLTITAFIITAINNKLKDER